MSNLVKKADYFAALHYQCSAKEFIENGIKKGRHYFYLRDALELTDKKFLSLMKILGIDIEKVEATKAEYEKIFEEPVYVEEEEIEELYTQYD